MTSNLTKDSLPQPTTLQEALNIIRFLTTSHKQEISRLKDAYIKQTDSVKKLESNRKKELEFLSTELQKYEASLALRTETVAKQLAEKDDIIQKQAELIEELNNKLKLQEFTVPEINVIDSNSDSGVALEDSNNKIEETKAEVKATRKTSRRFTDHISFLRKVDFSPMKYKPSSRENKKKDDKKKNLEVPLADKRSFRRQLSNEERVFSDDDRLVSEETVLSDSTERYVLRPKNMNDSMNNHFSDDGSEDTSEEVFDRVMARSSIRRSVKANPKYKKINRTKSKLLEQVKVNIVD